MHISEQLKILAPTRIVVLMAIKNSGIIFIKMILIMMATKKFYLEAVRGRLIALKSRSETAKLKKNYFQS